MNTVHLEPNQVPNHLKRNYTGKAFKAEIVESVTIPAEAGLWYDGCRDTYSAIELATGNAIAASDNVSAPWDDRKSQKIALTSGFAIVRHSIFAGKDMGLTFYVHPSDAVALLPANNSDLNDTEKRFLAIVRGIKSSYRADYYRRMNLSQAEVETIKASLISRDYLNKAGAITVKGRNACENVNPY